MIRKKETMQALCIVTACLVMAASCMQHGNRPATGDAAATDSAATTTEATANARVSHQLILPTPPAILTDAEDCAAFIAQHYWDNFNFRDTTWIADTATLEQTYANYIAMLKLLSAESAANAQKQLIRRSAVCAPILARMASVAAHYLDNPNSPLRSEDLYIPVLEELIASDSMQETDKIRPRYRLEMVRKNRPGMMAADFAYTTASGSSSRLSALRAYYTLLFFYNPGCPECMRVKEYIAASQPFSADIQSGKLRVLAVYPDEDVDQWRQHLEEMPQDWTVGYDRGSLILEKKLYDLCAIPCLYLLDAQKRVILKDATVEQIEAWIAGITN
ncbi:DUF5106 domain-containing protein [Bacteroides sp.]|uniref:DUF5106 domain-containing protein n=1 Tax=Bacteroides sp. TaxID=29523 RepID=UPI003AB6DCF3